MSGFELMSRQCDQCLMSPNRIVSGRRASAILRDCRRRDVSFECHKGTLAGRKIHCRAHFNTGAGQMSRIAERLGMIIEIDPDTLLDSTPCAPTSPVPAQGSSAIVNTPVPGAEAGAGMGFKS